MKRVIWIKEKIKAYEREIEALENPPAKPPLSESRLADLAAYSAGSISIFEIAGKWGTSEGMVRLHQRRNGFAAPKGLRIRPEVAAAARAWSAGESLPKIKTRTGHSSSAVVRAADIMGLVVQSRRRAKAHRRKINEIR